MEMGLAHMAVRGLVVMALFIGISVSVQAQELPTEIEEMGELAAALQERIVLNRELINGMREYENQLQAELEILIQSGLDLSLAIVNKQLEVVHVKLRAEQFERLQKIKGSEKRIKKAHKIYTAVSDVVADSKSGAGTVAVGLFANLTAAAAGRPGVNKTRGQFFAQARTIRKLTELGVKLYVDIPARQQVLADFREQVRNAEQRDLALTRELVGHLREIRAAMQAKAPDILDAWGIRLQNAAGRNPKAVADLGLELDSFTVGFDKAISVGGVMAPVAALKSSLIPFARSTFDTVSKATGDLSRLTVREDALQREAAAARLVITGQDRDLRDQIDAAVQRVSTLFRTVRRGGQVRPKISEGQADFLNGPDFTSRSDLKDALDDLAALLDALPNTLARRQTQRVQQAGGNAVLVGMRIDMGARRRLSADALTARVTGDPHSVPLVVTGRHEKDTRRDCTFRVESNGRLVDRVRSQRVFTRGPDLAIQPTMSGMQVTTLRAGIVNRIEGTGSVGRERITAEAVARTDFAQRPAAGNNPADACRDFVPKMEPVRTTREFDVVKVTAAILSLNSSVVAEGDLIGQPGDLDAFISQDEDIAVGRSGFRIDLEELFLETPDGIDSLGRGVALSFGGAGEFSVAQDGTGVTFTATRPGSGFYSVFIDDGEGGQHFQEDLSLTANGLAFEVEQLDQAADFLDPIIDLIGQNEIRLVVDGAADMSGYRVRWSVDGGVQVTQPLARFRRAGGVAIAATSLSAADPASAAGKSHSVSAELLSPAGVEIARGTISVVTSVVGNDIRLVALGTNVGVAAKDIFVPTRRNDFGAFEVQVNTDGTAVQAPLRLFDARVIGNGFLRFDDDTLRASFDAPGGGANTTTRDIGRFVARAEPRDTPPEGLPRFILPTFRANSDSVFITVNKLNVKQGAGSSGPQTVLEVFGPADMQKYRARFVLRDGSNIDSSFASADTAAEAVADVVPDAVRTAQVIGQFGQVLGEFRLRDDGPVLGPPQFTFRIPNQAVPGQAVVIFANVVNVPFDDAGDFDCRWAADPAFGTFDRNIVTLSPVSGNGGLCVNTLRVAEDPQLVGRETPIEVDLVRVVGAAARDTTVGAE